jgi:Putative adhesin
VSVNSAARPQPARHDPPWWVVVLAIPLFGASVILFAFAGLTGVSLIDSVTASRSISHSLELAPGGSVNVDVTGAGVVVEPGPAGQVSVEDWMQVKSPTRALARQALATLEQSAISAGPGGDTVSVPQPIDFNLLAFQVNRKVTVRVPADVSLKLTGGQVAADIHDLVGNLDVTVNAGAVRLVGVTVNGSDRIAATSGAVAFDGTLESGSLDVETESGAIAVHLPRGTNASYDVGTTNGAIFIQPETGRSTAAAGGARSFTGTLGNGGGTAIRLRARSGALTIIVGSR